MAVYSPTRYEPDKSASNEQRILRAVEYIAEKMDDLQKRMANIEQAVGKNKGGIFG